jgi:uncharacterized protein YcbX
LTVFIADIQVYPIKSLGGFSVKEWPVLPEGLAFDRQWMLVDENGKFITQRANANLALLKVHYFHWEDDFFEVESLLTQSKIQIPIKFSSESKKTIVWDDEVDSFYYQNDINKWFSSELGMDCFLVKKDSNFIRQVDLNFASPNNSTGFSDGFPVLVISESSLNDLNSRLEFPVPMNRFRPNIVLSGTHAFQEDETRELILGETEFNLVKPCGRCIMTTINQSTAEKTAEPLKTLSLYRAFNNKILFGMNALVKRTGKIYLNELVHLVQSS